MLCKKVGKYILIIMLLSAVFLNLLAWSSSAFCDFYVAHIFPLPSTVGARLSGLFPFSVGEWMLIMAVVLVLAIPIGGIICLVSRRWYRWYRGYLNRCGFIFAAVTLIMTSNCLILFHCSPITAYYPAFQGKKSEYSIAELARLRDYVVMQANALAEQLPRDPAGYLAYDPKGRHDTAPTASAPAYSRAYLIAQAQTEMERLGEEYPRLSGYYPRPKAFYFSHFFSQQYMMGYYFPFSMEANYNNTMYVVNIPFTLCHELSHLKGFIYEDEANFLGYLAGVDSSEPLFRYSAYLSVLGYLDRDFYEAVGRDAEIYRAHPAISERVKGDDIFLTPKAWAQVEERALFETQLVKEIADEIVEANLTLNGVADGKLSYGRVVELLLRYYDGRLGE